MSFVGLEPRGGLLGRAEVLVPRLEVIVLGRTPVGYGLKTSNSFSQRIHEIQFVFRRKKPVIFAAEVQIVTELRRGVEVLVA